MQFTARDGFWFFLTVDVIVITGVATRGIVGSTAVAVAKAAAAVLSIVVIGSWTLPPRVVVAGRFHIIAVTVIVAMPMVVC